MNKTKTSPQSKGHDPSHAKGLEERAKAVQIYRDGINELLTRKIDQNISNGLPDHASVLFEQFFKHAKDRIIVFCKNLSGAVFDEDFVVSAAKSASNRGVKIEVMIQDEAPDSKLFATFLKEVAGITIRRVEEGARNLPYNFSVMDERAYRFEPNRAKVEAVANMNKPEIASKLIGIFEELRFSSHPISA